MYDSHVEVLEALYNTPATLACAVLSSPNEYIDALSASIASPSAKPKRASLRLHLGFLLGHILGSLDIKTQEVVFQRLLLPFLLFSKPRQHTAELVWEAIEPVIKATPALELLKGCPEIIKDKERSVDNMVATNVALVTKVAENIVASKGSAKHTELLVTLLQGENTHARSFAFLTLRALLERLPQSQQVDVAYKALDTIQLEQLPAVDDLPDAQGVAEAVKPEAISRFVVVKPNSKTTLAWLQIGLITEVAKLSPPINQDTDWFKDIDPVSTFFHPSSPSTESVCRCRATLSISSRRARRRFMPSLTTLARSPPLLLASSKSSSPPSGPTFLLSLPESGSLLWRPLRNSIPSSLSRCCKPRHSLRHTYRRATGSTSKRFFQHCSSLSALRTPRADWRQWSV